MTVFCICTFFKGSAFLEAAKEAGNRVYLLTDQKLAEKPWPWEAIDEVFYLDEVDNTFSTYQKLLDGVAHVMRDRKIDVVVALDDFDVEKAALVREHFRIPGMGQTTARYFRDKLAMRIRAQDQGLPVPPFSPLFTDIVTAENIPAGTKVATNKAFLTFVAVDQTGRPIEVPEALPESAEEKELYASALRRRQLRLVLAGRMKPEEATELKAIFGI